MIGRVGLSWGVADRENYTDGDKEEAQCWNYNRRYLF
jgi:hypothetical protein